MASYFGLTVFLTLYLATPEIIHEAFAVPASNDSKTPAKKRLAVIVPFRDRFEQLTEFVPHMYKFLNKQKIPFRIFVIEQADTYRFNRGSLINIGFIHSKKYDYIAIHDVDLLPLNDELSYSYPESNPIHIASPKTHPNYTNPDYFGGILLINREHFELVKGMSNNYWGWGGEDEEFYWRLWDAGLRVLRPRGITTGREDTFRHIHDESHPRDNASCYGQSETLPLRERQSGFHTVTYRLRARRRAAVRAMPVTVIIVALICDPEVTPWCRCPAED